MNRIMTKRVLLGAVAGVAVAWSAHAALTFRHTVTGEVLSLDYARDEGRDTRAVQEFLQTGVNLYNENTACLPAGEDIFLTACSGCHGHHAEGKIGPGLNDNYWTYPKNETDKGLFETVYGGAQGQMGPQYGALTLDEMLLAMAWVRHLYTGPVADATWLTADQRQGFTPYSADEPQLASTGSPGAGGECAPASQ